jgi:hypothetical protein
MSHRYSLSLLAAGVLLCGCTHETEVASLDSKALVAAIRAANQRPGPDSIRLAKGGLYVLRDQAEVGLLLPTISGELVIDGQGAEIRRGSNARSALLQVASGGKVSLNNLSLAEGSDGAVRNYGTLRLQSVKITDSSSWDSSAIVLNHGILQAKDSEIAYNELPMNRRDGGTVLNYGEMVLDNTHIHDNLVQARYPSLAAAGAILNLGTIRISESGIDHNTADDESTPLNAAGIIDLGNGRVDGHLPVSLIREAGRFGETQTVDL